MSTSAVPIGQAQFAPSLLTVGGPRNLYVNIAGGTAIYKTAVTTVPSTAILCAANATTFIYYSGPAGAIQSSTSGFPWASGTYPIATAVSNANQVVTLTDVRGAVFLEGGH